MAFLTLFHTFGELKNRFPREISSRTFFTVFPTFLKIEIEAAKVESRTFAGFASFTNLISFFCYSLKQFFSSFLIEIQSTALYPGASKRSECLEFA